MKLIGNANVYRNAFWMMLEKIISMAGVFLVSSFVAKYVGPLIWGEIALAIVFFQIVQIISQMGGDNILFRRISKKRNSGIRLMKSTSVIRFSIYISLSSLLMLYFYFSGKDGLSIYIIAVCVSFLFSTIDVFTIYNNAVLASKVNTVCNIFGLVISLGVRYLIAYFKFRPEYLAIPIVLNTLIPYIIRFVLFKIQQNKHGAIRKEKAKDISRYTQYMLSSGVSIVLASVAIAIYTRINQIFLDRIDGTTSVGIYSVAATVGTSWVFISQALITSFYTKIYSEKNDKTVANMVARLNRMILVISAAFVVLVVLFGEKILYHLYGNDYVDAYKSMVILSIASLISSLGTVSYRFMIRSSGFAYLSKKMIILLIMSFPISYFFVLKWGLTGAAYSSLIIEFLSLTFLNYFYQRGIVYNVHKQTFFLKGN